MKAVQSPSQCMPFSRLIYLIFAKCLVFYHMNQSHVDTVQPPSYSFSTQVTSHNEPLPPRQLFAPQPGLD
jgi:hypothetical protein